MEALAAAGSAARRDLELVYEGMFLAAFARFEVLLEELFFGLFVGRISGAAPRVAVKSERVAREIVMRERKYIDWLPYGRAEEIAKTFLKRGHPFTVIDQREKGNLAVLLTLRHAIAHKSKHARESFRSKVLGSTPLPPRERTPAGFLRSQFRIAPAQTRFELYMQQLSHIARRIAG